MIVVKLAYCMFILDQEQMVAGYTRRYSKRTRRYVNRPSSSFGALRNQYRQPDRITFDEINDYVKDKHILGNLMITICDKGYLDVFRLFYRINKMEQYTNFVAFILDKEGYEVMFNSYPLFVDLKSRRLSSIPL